MANKNNYAKSAKNQHGQQDNRRDDKHDNSKDGNKDNQSKKNKNKHGGGMESMIVEILKSDFTKKSNELAAINDKIEALTQKRNEFKKSTSGNIFRSLQSPDDVKTQIIRQEITKVEDRIKVLQFKNSQIGLSAEEVDELQQCTLDLSDGKMRLTQRNYEIVKDLLSELDLEKEYSDEYLMNLKLSKSDFEAKFKKYNPDEIEKEIEKIQNIISVEIPKQINFLNEKKIRVDEARARLKLLKSKSKDVNNPNHITARESEELDSLSTKNFNNDIKTIDDEIKAKKDELVKRTKEIEALKKKSSESIELKKIIKRFQMKIDKVDKYLKNLKNQVYHGHLFSYQDPEKISDNDIVEVCLNVDISDLVNDTTSPNTSDCIKDRVLREVCKVYDLLDQVNIQSTGFIRYNPNFPKTVPFPRDLMYISNTGFVFVVKNNKIINISKHFRDSMLTNSSRGLDVFMVLDMYESFKNINLLECVILGEYNEATITFNYYNSYIPGNLSLNYIDRMYLLESVFQHFIRPPFITQYQLLSNIVENFDRKTEYEKIFYTSVVKLKIDTLLSTEVNSSSKVNKFKRFMSRLVMGNVIADNLLVQMRTLGLRNIPYDDVKLYKQFYFQ